MFYKLYSILKKENLLEQSFNDTSKSVEILRDMFIFSVDSIRKNKVDEQFNIYTKDKEINRIERKIRRNSLTHLAVNDQEDLNAVLILLTIVHDFERIGDYLKNIYEIAEKLESELTYDDLEDKVKLAESNISAVFEKLNDNFKDTEKDEAREYMETLNLSKKDMDDAIDQIVDIADNSEHNARYLIISVMYLRFLKRIMSHIVNILSSFVNPFDRIGFDE
jgi:phosphate transport system protein